MANLITLAEVKTLLGIQGTNQDDQINLLIAAVSQETLTYTDRDFGAPIVVEPREYLYDGSGLLDIDDATDVTAVTIEGSGLTTDEWIAQPYNAQFYWYLSLPPVTSVSPEMGFARNLDKWWAQAIAGRYVTVEVNASFGWPLADLPADVKLAVLWAIADGLESADREDDALIGESIADVSRTWAVPGLGTTGTLPDRSRGPGRLS